MSLGLTKIGNFVVLAEAWKMRALAWNPLTGCTGEGCAVDSKNCWAARRQKSFNPTYWPERAEKILHVRKPSIIVCNYLGEMFSAGWGKHQFRQIERGSSLIQKDYAIERVLQFQRQAPQHTYFWLSKHPERYADFDWPEGTWLGTTVNTIPSPIVNSDMQRSYELRGVLRPLGEPPRNHLRGYVYFEPLLGDWDFPIHRDILSNGLRFIDWVIIGGKSRGTLPGVEIHKESVAAVVAACEYLGIPVFCRDNLKPVFGAEFDSLPREVPKKPTNGCQPERRK